MQLITLDFETYYSKKEKYSLSSRDMTYEKYIRDKRFEVIGLAVKIGKRKSEWLAPHEIQDWLDHIEVAYGWDNVRMVAFNARFDAAILGWKYGIYPGQIADPMLMSRASQLWDGHSLDNVTRQLALQYHFGSTYDDFDGNFSYGMYEKIEEENGEIFGSNGFGYTPLVMKGTEVHDADGKLLFDFTDEEYDAYGEYAKTDVDLTWAAYNFFVHHRQFPEQEIDVMTATIETFTYPVLELDRKVLEIVDHNINSERQALLDKVGISVEEVRSDAKFAEALMKLGVKPPTKVTTTGKEKYAFAKKDLEFLALLDHEDQAVVELVEARLGNKSSQAVTRVKAFLELQERGNLPIPLEYYAAHTGRWGGSDRINVQNLNRNKPVSSSTKEGEYVFYDGIVDRFVGMTESGKVLLARKGLVENDDDRLHEIGLRDALKAPNGKVLVVLDWSQIELRGNAWLWGEQWILDTLVSGKDIYKVTAANTYGISYDEVNKSQRFVGKSQQLGLGYGAGVNGLKVVMGKRSEEFTDQELQSFVNSYRLSAPRIKRGWDHCKTAFNAMVQGVSVPLNDAQGLFYTDGQSLVRPNGMRLTYPKIHHRQGDMGKELWFWGKNPRTKKPDWEKTFGGKGDENNCIAEDTEVLTDRGWVPIQYVTRKDKVFDGVEFVTHKGILFKSAKECVNIDGVFMTEDHEVLTNDGWKQAGLLLSERGTSSIQRLDGATLREVSRNTKSSVQKPVALALAMRLWGNLSQRSKRCEKGRETRSNTKLRLLYQRNDNGTSSHTRNVEAPYLCDMAFNEAAVYATEPQGVAQLWWTWDNGVSALVRQFRELSGRYVSYLQAGFGFRSDRQQRKLRTSELPLGISQTELYQHTEGGVDRYGRRDKNVVVRFFAGVWHWSHNVVVSAFGGGKNATVSGNAKPRKKVFDILDCGKRNRFVVRGSGEPFIVHNCQSLCRDIAAEKVVDIRADFKEKGWTRDDAHIVMTVHDEIIACCKEELAEEVEHVMRVRMTESKGWYATFPLAVDGGTAKRYGGAK